jgi:hypothetical protein
MFGDASQHSRTDFITVMKSEDKVRPTVASENLMGTARLPLHRPADSEEGGKDSP